MLPPEVLQFADVVHPATALLQVIELVRMATMLAFAEKVTPKIVPFTVNCDAGGLEAPTTNEPPVIVPSTHND